MNVLMINGSPRRESGNTERVMSAIAVEVAKRGGETSDLYLVDGDPDYCTACGHPCFSDGTCALEDGATLRSERIRDADAMVLGAPVYCWQPNALTCTLFDKFRIPSGTWMEGSAPGIPAMGIAVAGGTGTGVFPALQSMYAWLCAWRFSPLDPVPVTRYNIHGVIENAAALADSLMRRHNAAFGERWDHMLVYDELPYMMYGRVDEYEWLSRQMIAFLESSGTCSEERQNALAFLEEAVDAEQLGKKEDRAKLVMSAFESTFDACR